MDTTSGTIQVKATFTNSDDRLTPGAFVKVNLDLETLKDTVIIPAAALQQNGNDSSVYIVNAEKQAEIRKVVVRDSRDDIAAIASGLDPKRYDVVPVKIAKNGSWWLDPAILPKDRRRLYKKSVRYFVPDPTVSCLLDAQGRKAERIDVVFPIVHGTFGEDGALQGLLEMAEVPYVGSGVLGSAVGMDKIVAKRLLRDAGLLPPRRR